jgi:hypothetical protein
MNFLVSASPPFPMRFILCYQRGLGRCPAYQKISGGHGTLFQNKNSKMFSGKILRKVSTTRQHEDFGELYQDEQLYPLAPSTTRQHEDFGELYQDEQLYPLAPQDRKAMPPRDLMLDPQMIYFMRSGMSRINFPKNC